jgi:hypothetical protein
LNLRPSGYEPDELPDCSTPHLRSETIPKGPETGKGQVVFPFCAGGAWSQ